MTTIDVRRADDRTFQRIDGIHSRFSFAFAGNFDLAAGAHGTLMVHNDDEIDALMGVDPHTHTDAEIVTWVLDGRIEHADSAGHTGEISAGWIQRISAGKGIRHTERNPDKANKVHVLQMWAAPDTSGLEPEYAQVDLNEQLDSGELVTALSGIPGEDPGVGIHNRWTALDIARPRPGAVLDVKAAPFHHVFLARGSARVLIDDADADSPVDLRPGDALRLTDAPAFQVEAIGEEPVEFLVWRMHAHF
ncbi:MAG TPA: pirin family protein [Dietzia timorensis]|uniref:Pirin family protein n=1 Tax=Dietzia timorensis TaxID=499555 RepID=A0A921F4I5_9ACTN|nr:pirin family protein [Dietzia timorensis]HJE90718.1 pirin family protein [Dietzia timorensis]